MSQTGSAAGAKPANNGAVFLGLTPAQILALVGTIAGAVVPEATVAGMTISQLTNLSVGVANGASDAIAAFEEVAAAKRAGATELPPELWEKLNAAADAANTEAAEAEDEVIEGGAGNGAGTGDGTDKAPGDERG